MNINFTALKVAIIFSLLTTTVMSQAQVVNIPDANFKAALVANHSINTNGDGEIQTTEAAAFDGIMTVGNKNISDLTGISAFTALTDLYCYTNNLTSIDLSANTQLKTLWCNHNQLTSLDVSSNVNLTDLRCHVNAIPALDLSNNPQLTVLLNFQNQLTALDVSANTSLTQLQCSFNQLTSLDVSENPNLTSLDCRKNQLTFLNVKNGNNTEFTTFNATFNRNLGCIQVDDPAYSEANWTNTDSGIFFSADCGAANANLVNIPDANFKAVLVANTIINKNGDGEIQVAEASTYGGTIYAAFKNIADLTGIEAFTSITGLYCNSNSLNSLDVSNNTALTVLRCDHNNLASLDVSHNVNLKDLLCYYNQLTTLDIHANTALTTLWCFGNTITSLDASASTMITELKANHNQLTSLVLGNNPNLTTLYTNANRIATLDVHGTPGLKDLRANLNQITALDVSANTLLSYLNIGDNPLTSLNVTNNPNLKNLWAYNNKYDSLDLRSNTQLEEFYAAKNPLTYLNVKSGHNTTLAYFNTVDTPGLLCIEVDNPAYSEANWTLVDPHSTFSADCGGTSDPAIVFIPDTNFKAYLVGNSQINTNGDSEIQVTEAEAYSGVINVINRSIRVMTGIEAFKNISLLDCSRNLINGHLDVSQNTHIVELRAEYNGITSLVTGINPVLQVITTDYCPITSLDVTNNPALRILQSPRNRLTVLDLSSNASLVEVNVGVNQIGSLDLRSSTNLETFIASNNLLTSIDLSTLTKLQNLQLGGNQLTSLDVSASPELVYLYAGKNLLTSLDVTGNPDLDQFSVDRNQITSLDLSQNHHLTSIQVSDNKLTALNVKNGNNHNITFWYQFRAYNNPDLFCIQVDDVEYAEANFSGDQQTDPWVGFSTDCGASDIVYIPDTNFKNSLLSRPAINTNGDSEIQVTEANAFTGTIQIAYLDIYDLTGIQAFTEITGLNAEYNILPSVDLSKNTKLTFVNLNDNTNLSSLDVSVNLLLESLSFSRNKVVELILGEKPNLKHLAFATNLIESVNLEGMDKLEVLNFSDNQIYSTVDLSTNTALTELVCSYNYIKSLDLTTNENLTSLSVQGNHLLLGLDLRTNLQLHNLEASSCQLVWLNIQNAGPDGLVFLGATGNPDLECIQVNDVAYAEANWTDNVDAGASFRANCLEGDGVVYIPDPTFKSFLLANADINVNGDDEIQFSEARRPTYFDVGFKDIADMTGIEAFVNMTGLNCERNDITSLDLPPNITWLACSNNQIKSITGGDINTLYATNNMLTSLPDMPNAKELFVYNNRLTELDISQQPFIYRLDVHNNQLTSLNVQNGNNTEFNVFDARGNSGLECIQVDDPANSQANWTHNVDPGVTFSTDCGNPAAMMEAMNMSISISPNPTAGKLSILSSLPVDEVRVYDVVNGDLVHIQQGNDVDLTSQHAGVYMVKIQTGTKVSLMRVVKR